jgi:hypothetical protein
MRPLNAINGYKSLKFDPEMLKSRSQQPPGLEFGGILVPKNAHS